MIGIHISNKEERRNDVLYIIYKQFEDEPFTCNDVQKLTRKNKLGKFACQTLREWKGNTFIKKGKIIYIDSKPVNTWKFTSHMLDILYKIYG